MDILKIKQLCKSYPAFTLQDVSFNVEKGHIMGFVGRNGAGKTTTLKTVMNMVRSDSGKVEVFGLDMSQNERAVKQRTGFAGTAADYYKKKKISRLLDITKTFYDNWDDEAMEKYLKLFSIDKNKTPSQLSQGMKVKLGLVTALSHGAELLILDEPTSGLDPVSRDELLQIFKYLRSQGVSILFSTHITSDLDKCADDITYIKDGQIVYTGSMSGFVGSEKLEDVIIKHERESFYEKTDL